MKTFFSLLLFAALAAHAEDASDITTKVSERRNKDGSLRWRIETTSRGKTPVLQVYQSSKGGVTGTTRSYMAGGEVVMMETDEDGDGVFETIIAYRPQNTGMEVFTRQRDGSVRPVSAQAHAAYKEKLAAITGLWDKALDKDMDKEKFVESVRQTQQKIRDAEKGKIDAKK